MLTDKLQTVRVRLPASLMYSTSGTIDSEILRRLQNRFGDRCSSSGFVFRSSIVLTSRGEGVMDTVKLDGGMLFDCNFTARVLTLEEGESLKCRVVRKNEAGVMLSAVEKQYEHTPLVIVMPRLLHHDEGVVKAITDLSVGDEIRTTVLGCRFQPNETLMNVVVRYESPTSAS